MPRRPTAKTTSAPKLRGLFLVALLGAGLLGSCGERRTTTLPSGVRIEWLREGEGPTLTDEDWVLCQYDAWTEQGTWVDTTRDDDHPFLFPARAETEVIPGLEEALRRLKVGDRVSIHLPAETAYGSVGKPPHVPADSALLYELEVAQRLERRDSGLRIATLVPGSGELPRPGQWAVVDYVLRNPLSGRAFDRSGSSPLEFEIGAGHVLSGLDEAVRLCRPGSEVIAVLPPELGFGPAGVAPWIPAGASLLYELKVRGFRS